VLSGAILGGRVGLCRRGLRGALYLEDGSLFEGCGFGYEGVRVGEVVFTTSMVGYPESITDPSYRGQILVLTHPLIGNYGVARRSFRLGGYDVYMHFESGEPQIEGLVVFEETSPSHWSSEKSLHEWLREYRIPGVSRMDTRGIVKRLRDRGVMMGVIATWEGDDLDVDRLVEILSREPRYEDIAYAHRVSPREPVRHGDGGRLVAILDCGVKHGILREIILRGFSVIRYPCWSDPSDVVRDASGVIISNGPGNPAILREVIENVRELLEYSVPTLGICLGHQLIALALGGDVFKLRYGHRGANKPVLDLETGLGYVSTQNHGYAVDPESLSGTGFKPWFINIDDSTLEGIRHEKKPIMGVQFHPEAGPGPYDLTWVFDLFAKLMAKHESK
jgi:carbamoyl-phosphate synthase small subunit